MALSKPLLKNKFFPPPPVSDFVERKKLNEKLDEMLAKSVLLVSAPTGFGKSTFISSWLRRENKNFAWLSLRKQENDFQQFISYFTYAIHQIHPSIGKEILELSSAPEMPLPIELADYFINYFLEIGEQFLLVLDDYHLIRNRKIHQFISKLLDYPIGNFCLILITRRDPALPLSAWRSKNIISEIRANDLRFKKNEIKTFFKQAAQIELNKTNLTIIEKVTEGWISGLRLLLLTLKNKSDVNKELINSSYKDSHIFQRLLFDVVQDLPETYRKYLYKLSVVEEFNQSLFSALCLEEHEKNDASEIFGNFVLEITNSNIFFISLDEKHHWYRFHHLVNLLLQNKPLNTISEKELRDVKLKAANWFISVDEKEQGLKHLLEAEKYSDAVILFSEIKNTLLSNSRWHKLETIYNWFPKNSINCYSALLIVQAWIFIYKGNIPETLKLIQPIEDLIKKENLTAKEKDNLRGELHMLKAWDLYVFNVDMEACLYHSKEAIQLINPTNTYALGTAWIFYGGAMQTMQKSEEAKQKIYGQLAKEIYPGLKVSLYLILCYIEWLDGDLKSLIKTASQMEMLGLEIDSKEALANGKYFRGIALYLSNEMESARKDLQCAYKLRYFTILVHGFFSMAAYAYSLNELGEAEQIGQLVSEMEKVAVEKGGAHYVKFAKSIVAEIEWINNNSQDALKWATENSFLPLIPMSNFMSPQLVQLKILTTDKNPYSWQMGYNNVGEVIDFLRETNNSNFLIRTLILKAIMEFKLNKNAEAAITIKESIEMAHKRNFNQPFIHLKEELAPLFLELDEVTIPEDFLSLISPNDSPPETILTNREIEILHNMSDNLSNKELGSRLFISESTVKRHIANIFKKLEAKNRRDALAKARELRVV